MDILDRYLTAVLPLIDVEEIVRSIVELARTERNSDFDSFEASAAYLQRRFHSTGIAADVLRFPADGRARLQCWTAPIGFRTTRAICAIVAPQASARVLGSRPTEPYTAIVGTGHTGPKGVEAEVVHIRDPEALHAATVGELDLAGKIVYSSTLRPSSIRQAVVNGGGIALVSSYTKYRAINHEHVAWINTWDSATDAWLPTAQAQTENLPGISISPAMGDYLETLLAQRPVRLRIVTQGAYFESTFPGVTAALPGEEDRWVFLTGHLFEPGLTDNAAGAVLGFWTSHAIQELSGTPGFRLRRGLRNFHSQECYGVLGLKQVHPQVLNGALAHLNIDMTGASEPPLSLNPGLLASAGLGGTLMRRVLERACRHVAGVPHTRGGFDINCTLLSDPLLGGLPTTQLEQVNKAWHTSRDRAGTFELDRDTLRYTALAAATWAAFLACAGLEEAEWLLGEFEREVRTALKAGDVADSGIYLTLKQQEMSSVAELVPEGQRAELLDRVRAFIDRMRAGAPAWNEIVPAGSPQEIKESRHLYPRALLGGPAVDACFTPAQLADLGQPKWSYKQLVLKAWADGTRSVYEIARLASFETGAAIDLGYALAFFEHYAQQGIVTLDP
jgi:hypothetical protein